MAMAKAVDRLLRAKGFNVEIFYSAETFLASASATVARCLVADIQLGGMSGIDLCRPSRGAAHHPPSFSSRRWKIARSRKRHSRQEVSPTCETVFIRVLVEAINQGHLQLSPTRS